MHPCSVFFFFFSNLRHLGLVFIEPRVQFTRYRFFVYLRYLGFVSADRTFSVLLDLFKPQVVGMSYPCVSSKTFYRIPAPSSVYSIRSHFQFTQSTQLWVRCRAAHDAKPQKAQWLLHLYRTIGSIHPGPASDLKPGIKLGGYALDSVFATFSVYVGFENKTNN